jgi:hypothetical protein
MNILSFGTTRVSIFGTLIWEYQRKVIFGCSPHGEAQNILKEGSGAFSLGLWVITMKNCVHGD